MFENLSRVTGQRSVVWFRVTRCLTGGGGDIQGWLTLGAVGGSGECYQHSDCGWRGSQEPATDLGCRLQVSTPPTLIWNFSTSRAPLAAGIEPVTVEIIRLTPNMALTTAEKGSREKAVPFCQ
ncbi:hypothetical protein Bbelb_237330 [Branchiostoma belcheri]|nr:hypothetical protein Bbelb_237330 [Branchiostoma belcheri]